MRVERNIQPTEIKIRRTPGLESVPSVRPEKVVRGKALIADPSYPSPQHIRQIARHFAANWNGEDDLFDGLSTPAVNRIPGRLLVTN